MKDHAAADTCAACAHYRPGGGGKHVEKGRCTCRRANAGRLTWKRVAASREACPYCVPRGSTLYGLP